ncbi:hypothetical protein VB618_09780 [Microvirga sp. CF3062]|uniref:hypothetical protein n=1 Tax=Microvirga sp. CF3062 TaxID=3110182 RepID=UPI002E7A03CD|nr:hypothetical protein [Microvirga sp. CF3062]MEE1656487.1 hypothetical protein [Microvirga sp. CF3062]
MKNRLSNPTIGLLIEWYGVRRAYEIVMELGGLRHYVPVRVGLGIGGRLSSFLTDEELKPLIDEFGGNYIKMPIARGFCIEFLYWIEGQSIGAIAKAVRITEQGVLNALGPKPPIDMASIAVRSERDRGGGAR